MSPRRNATVTLDRTPGEIEAFIRARLRLGPAPAVPEIRLFQSHSGSGLTRFVGERGLSPYWAHNWAGGTVLARHILDHPDAVRGRRVLDLGTGSGLVAIAAAKAGAIAVRAADIDPAAGVAARLNALENDVAVDVRVGDGLDALPSEVDLITVGDLFYEPVLAGRVAAFLDRGSAAGIAALIGDPGRRHLPLHRLRKLADLAVPDFGQSGSVPAAVYEFKRDPARS